jgi:hypothetical protein
MISGGEQKPVTDDQIGHNGKQQGRIVKTPKTGFLFQLIKQRDKGKPCEK